MDSQDTGGFPWKSVTLGIFMSLLVVGIAFLIIRYRDTRPLVSGFVPYESVAPTARMEAFTATNGVGLFPCSQESSESAHLYGMFVTKDITGTATGKQDLLSLHDLLAKMACFKRDLLSPRGLISAVKELRFNTYSDIQNVADTTSRCLSKQIPERDLEIQIDKWRVYGLDLIRRLCTATNLSEKDVVYAEKLFITALRDVSDVAKIKCLTGKPIQENPGLRDPQPVTPNELLSLRKYDGYF